MNKHEHSEPIEQTRRRFLQVLGGIGVAAGTTSAGLAEEVASESAEVEEVEGTVGGLSFYSSASQIAADGESELEDDDVALVRAEPTAFNFKTTADGPETVVYEDNDVPIVSRDTEQPVVGFGSVEFVTDGNGGFVHNNEMFLLNLFDDLMGPDSVVAWDESHSQFWTLDNYETFRAYAAHEGYEIRASSDLLGSAVLTFPSTASQVASTGEDPLVDSSHVVVWAEPTAENVDGQGDGAVIYEDDDIPLVSRSGNVVGFGTPELIEDGDLTTNNEQFVLNLLEDTVGGTGTVLWDDAHDTFFDSSKFTEFAGAIEAEGYEFLSSGDELQIGDAPDVLTADPGTAGEPSRHTWELEDVEFGDSGPDGDEVDTITVEYENASLDGLTNDDVTVTMTRTLTGGKDTSEISVNQGEYSGSEATFDLSGNFETDVAGPVIVEIDGVENPAESETATIRLEGDADPVEVETELTIERAGIPTEQVDELEFFSTASLLDADGEPLADDSRIAVWAEPTAENVDESDRAESDHLEPASADPKTGAVHTWAFDDVDFEGEVDEITVEYPEGTSFDGLTNDDVTVVITRELAGGPDTSEISVNSGEYSGSEATFDLDGAFTTNIVGETSVEIDSVENPAPGDHRARITFTGEDDEVSIDDTLVIDSVPYPGDVDIPLVAVDARVVGIGAALAPDASEVDDNRRFLVNLWGDRLGGTGTVLYDESHGQGLALEDYSELQTHAESRGFTVDTIEDDFVEALTADDTDAVMIATDGDDLAGNGFTADDLDALAAFVDDGGALFLHDTSDFGGDSTAELNEIVEVLDADFRFNADQVEDDESSGWAPFIPRTSTFNEDFPVFEEDVDDAPTLGELEFFSTASLLDENEEPLTDESRIAVWAEPTAENESNEGDFVEYPEDVDIPLVAVDGRVVGIGSELAPDASSVDANRRFVVNTWEDRLGGTGTVLYDESHGQGLALEDYSELQTHAQERGFTVDAIEDDFVGALGDADAVMIATDDDDLDSFSGFTDAELDALAEFVNEDGGALFLHDTADFGGDSSAVLNEVAEAVGVDFRFNTDQVVDEENSGFAPYVPRTSNFNEGAYPGFFEGEAETPATIAEADVVAIASPAEAYSEEELDALEAHVGDGGALFLFDESEFINEETDNLNEIADRLDLDFRFNADQVEDPVNNDGIRFVPTTTNFNEGFDVFDGVGTVGFPDADGVVVTTPERPFNSAELDELAAFVDDGGALFLFDQSDFGGLDNEDFGFDETENFNEIADALDLDFRFNSDQVNDEENNVGPEFDILTANYDVDPDDPGVFEERETGIGISFDRDEEYFGRVVRVFDGDTFEVEFDERHDPLGFRDVIRHIGIDTAETGAAVNEPEEWFGIPDDALDHLDYWGGEATQFSLDVMAPGAEAGEENVEGRRVKMTFDEREPLRGNFGRLLMYMEYDPDDFDADPDDGNFSVDYNYQTVEEGYARVYSSGFGRHDEFAAAEEAALEQRLGVWEAADFDALDEIRNDAVEKVFVPRASSVTGANGTLDDDSVVVRASDGATQEPLDDGSEAGPSDGSFDEYDEPPLVGIDVDNRVAMFGGVLLHERYEEDGDADVTEEEDLEAFGNFPLFTNVVQYLSQNEGDFIIEGGHEQFNVEGSVSLERVQFYLRFVEGVGGRLRQINDVVNTLPAEDEAPRVVFLTAPGRAYTDEELDSFQAFRDDGGAVVLLGSAAAAAEARENLNDVAAALGSELRLNDDRILDENSNLAGEPDLPVSDNFNRSIPVFMPANLTRGDNWRASSGRGRRGAQSRPPRRGQNPGFGR